MGFWSFLPFVAGDNDKPGPSPLEKERESWGTSPSTEILQRHKAQPRSDSGSRTGGNTTALATWSDPVRASRPTQRYLRSAGWKGTESPLVDTGDEGIDPESVRYLGQHQYGLTPWQQEQAKFEYGVDIPDEDLKLRGDAYRTGKMNASDYDALTPQQKNAIRFNELLIAATEADRQAAVPSEEQDPEYQTRLSEMFGTEGGSDVYAPNTLNLLDKMGMGKLRGQDLDEYLSLDRAYDMNEIKSLKPWDATPEVTPYEGFGQARSVEEQGILDQRQIDLAGGVLEKALADKSIRAWDDNSRIAGFLGQPRPAVDDIPFGWLNEGEVRSDPLDDEKENVFKNLYQHLSSGEATNLDTFWEVTEGYKFDDADYKEIFDYFYLQSLEDDRIGPGETTRLTGQQTRDLIGIGG